MTVWLHDNGITVDYLLLHMMTCLRFYDQQLCVCVIHFVQEGSTVAWANSKIQIALVLLHLVSQVLARPHEMTHYNSQFVLRCTEWGSSVDSPLSKGVLPGKFQSVTLHDLSSLSWQKWEISCIPTMKWGIPSKGDYPCNTYEGLESRSYVGPGEGTGRYMKWLAKPLEREMIKKISTQAQQCSAKWS